MGVVLILLMLVSSAFVLFFFGSIAVIALHAKQEVDDD